jgi:predicted ABC-type ATPase
VGDPVLHLLAGPNGAGKSTFVAELIGPLTGLRFINADEIAAQTWPGKEVDHAYEAADLASRERQRAIARPESFITETVFPHHSKVDLIREATAAGYHVTLHIVLIPEALAVARVQNRVEQGGHGGPEDKIRGSLARLWGHLRDGINLAEATVVYDNSRADHPFRRIASFSHGRLVGTPDWPAWTPDELRTAGRSR